MAARLLSAAALALALVGWTGNSGHAAEKVTLTGVHICCKGCAAAIEKAVAKAAGDEKHPVDVKCAVDAEKGSVELTGGDVKALQAGIDQIAAAGFHGKRSSKDVKWPKAKLPEGKVARLELTGVHNCCGACAKAIKAALAEVDGVKGDTVKAKESSFVVEGDFEPQAVVKALRKAGFHASVPEAKKK